MTARILNELKNAPATTKELSEKLSTPDNQIRTYMHRLKSQVVKEPGGENWYLLDKSYKQ